jgi:hypothetical protein
MELKCTFFNQLFFFKELIKGNKLMSDLKIGNQFKITTAFHRFIGNYIRKKGA